MKTWQAKAFAVASVLFLVLVVGVTESRAEGCRRVAIVQSAPVVSPGYVQQVVTPTYGHGYVQQVLVPQVQPIAVNPDFYFSVGDEYRQLAFAKLIAAEYAKMMQPQQPLGPAPQGIVQPTIPPAKEGIVVQPTAPPVAPPPAGSGAECKPVQTNLPQGFRELVAAKCATCHTSGKGKDFLDLTSLDALSTFPLATRDRMFRSVANNRMPKGAKAVEQAELDLFNAYAGLAEKAVFGTLPVMPEAKK
jgi:mono/diheme cytochrome c family protein